MLDSDAHKGIRKRRHIFRSLMSCHSTSVSDVEGEPIVESAAQREARLSRMKHNELGPITRLPPEVLADIFVRCVPVCARAVQDLKWLNVAQVSSQWRSIALACPNYWSTLVLACPNSIPVMLARSKMVSLIVRAELKKLDISPAPLLLEHAARLGTLELHAPQQNLWRLMFDLKDADAAPRLQGVKIVNTDMEEFLQESCLWLLPDLFERSAVLNSRKTSMNLHLESCAFPWDSMWYSHLTHLHLAHIHPVQRPTMKTFLGILLACPALETLAMLSWSPTTRSGFAVDLPLLTALTLRCDTSYTCACLLGYLVIPPSATLDVQCRIENDSDLKDALYISLIPQLSEAPPRCDILHVDHGGESVSISFADSEWTRKLSVSYSAMENLMLTEMLLEHLDLSSVSTLHLESFPEWELSLTLWDMMGRDMRSLRTVHLHRSLPNTLLEFLLTQALLLLNISDHRSCFSRRGPGELRGPGGAPTHAWPALTCLSLHGVNIGEATEPPKWDPPVPPRPAPADLLRALLWARRQGHARIWQLQIQNCENVFSADLAHFRLFAEVEYDGRGARTVQKSEQDGEELDVYSLKVFADLMEYSARMREYSEYLLRMRESPKRHAQGPT